MQVAWSLPPEEGRNGIIQGYKVLYQPAEDWYGTLLKKFSISYFFDK